MKCNEAFDMIFNGGEAVLPSREYLKDYRLHFNEDGVLCVPRVEHTKSAPVLHKADLKRDDWIVEKDGVVYERYPDAKKALCFICGEPVDNGDSEWSCIINDKGDSYRYKHNKCAAYIKDRIGTEDPPAELENNNQKCEEIKMQIQIDEEWLEKKVRCIIAKEQRQHIYVSYDDSKCGLKDCPFCFPDSSKEGKTQEAIDKPREKVTVEEVLDLVSEFFMTCCNRIDEMHSASFLEFLRLFSGHYNVMMDALKQKLEYLVNLQEK